MQPPCWLEYACCTCDVATSNPRDRRTHGKSILTRPAQNPSRIRQVANAPVTRSILSYANEAGGHGRRCGLYWPRKVVALSVSTRTRGYRLAGIGDYSETRSTVSASSMRPTFIGLSASRTSSDARNPEIQQIEKLVLRADGDGKSWSLSLVFRSYRRSKYGLPER